MALGMLAVCAIVASRWLEHKGLAWAANATTIAAFVLAIATVMVPLLRKLLGKLAGAPPVARMTLPEARADYADALDKQWAQEEQLRRVYDPWPLPVRWRPGDGQTRQFAGIKDTFVHLPAQRMVILGPAGPARASSPSNWSGTCSRPGNQATGCRCCCRPRPGPATAR